MAASKKLSMTGDDDLLNDLMGFKVPEKKPVEEKKVETKKTVKASLVLRMSEDMKLKLDEYCKKYDMTVTAGIKKAIREMLEKEVG